MAGLSANADDAFEPFDQVPDALLSAARAEDPLVQIAAGRVLWRIRWSGGAAVKARAVVQELGQSWRTQIEQENFLPPPELRERLRETLAADDADGQRARGVSARAIQRLGEAARDPVFTAEEAAAVRSALELFLSEPRYGSPLPGELNALPPAYLADVVAASFARLNNEEFEIPNGAPGTESDIAEPLNELRGRFIPDLEPLFAVYLAFSGRALTDWIGWLESHDGRDPGWAPFTNLMITWQLASVASWASMTALLDFLNGELRDRGDARNHFVALTFAELVIRIHRTGGALHTYGGGSVAPDIAVWETIPATVFSLDVLGRYDRSALVQVWYATDRAPTGFPEPNSFFGGARGDLSYGMAEITIPISRHRIGELESPVVWRLELREDPDRHVMLRSITPQPEVDFFLDIRRKIEETRRKQAFVFIHGYNVLFKDAARRAGQMAWDLNFDGAPILYSWPSQARVKAYNVDSTNAEWTTPHLKEFLLKVSERSGAQTIHLIAHSMGNRPLVNALSGLSLGLPKFHEIALAAPDIDAEVFLRLAQEMRQSGERVTVYASSRDRALRLSKRFNGYPRAGDLADRITVAHGVDTIDASAVSTSLMGHSDYGSNRSVLDDIFYLLRGVKVSDRAGIRPSPGGDYWLFQP